MGVTRTSCSTSPRAESAPGWKPPAFGLSEDVAADAVLPPVLLPEELDRSRDPVKEGCGGGGAMLAAEGMEAARMLGDARGLSLLLAASVDCFVGDSMGGGIEATRSLSD